MKNVTIFIFLSLAIINSAFAEQSLMRLFFSPAERAMIDIKREEVKKTPEAKATPLEQTEKIKVKGYLKRSGQPDVVWVNSEDTLKSNKPLADVKVLKVQADGKVKLKIRGKGTVKLKPGQIITRSQQPIREAYENSK